MRRVYAAAACALALAALGAGAFALQNETAEPPLQTTATAEEKAAAAEGGSEAPAGRRDASPRPRPAAKETPMAQRVAVLGLLNKRNGISRDLRMHPGQSVRVGDVIVRLRACETSAPWEVQKLTGAFVQVDVLGRDGKWRRPFSGWLFKESPSLNVVEHPIYDVWPKSCEMSRPETGPDTISVTSPDTPGSRRSRRANSAEPAPAPAPSPSASSSNDT